MIKYFLRLLKLVWGLFLFAFAAVVTIRANLGYHPYDVLNAGFGHLAHIKIGTAAIVTGLIFLLAAALLGEKIGIGSILNMLLIGIFMNLLLSINVLPQMKTFWGGILMLFVAMTITAIACFFYIGSGFCAGPRDSTVVGLMRKTGLSIGLVRLILEGGATLIGYLLGGKVGIGTLISALCGGYIIQAFFYLVKFDIKAVRHESLFDTYAMISKSSRKPVAEVFISKDTPRENAAQE